MQDEAAGVRNFGDFLSELIAEALVGQPASEAGSFRVIGSCIADWLIRDDLAKIGPEARQLVVYWCCGMRDDAAIDRETLRHCEIRGVRGPLTRDALQLPPDTVLGDSALAIPLIYKPRQCQYTAQRTVCVPHANDTREHSVLRRASQSQVVVSPWVEMSLAKLKAKIDEIVSAKFVLAGSLHAAIIAHAYKVPFAFWDNGFMDLPFKWRDFSASINIPTVFVRNMREAWLAYEALILPSMRRLPLEPMLRVSPFSVPDELLDTARYYDGRQQMELDGSDRSMSLAQKSPDAMALLARESSYLKT